ncbi:sigma-70 family RNA polymerase sigma factor [Stutzerimonas kirkiae]|uniref:RNA polymerase subunit sigma n=1 Tax=Stutzerimonas kirkiae TaxID=2211392 RepID=A0A4V2KCW0_9GAMM|nr:sigma-70 family RNA polymerase sigma factor [Stutzerimonas kirkiae]TBU96538.1 RNA polymerase subunit sigma [Stutzerimonas kirkiae]TBV02178.1 RNA polymerase subunit sigma [Stutzerimonas kirkiae]TBV08847.1 RNA polymerase subunit sigma [Stutzerimonas kirkiae]TBV15683.1 RNA polymerase subunit sigma [Stutzerimonas kirkiae]
MDDREHSARQLVGFWFEQNKGWLHARLCRRLGCSQNADDIVSETFVRVLSLPDPAAIREPRALLTTIAQRLMQESWRRRDLERAYLQLFQHVPEPVQPSPEARELLIETLLQIDRLLDGLPGQGRAAFIHSQLGGMTYSQVAAELGISVSRVQQYMTEAFRLCYGALEES